MVVIDTNVLYYVAGISLNNDVDIDKLKIFIKREEIGISSVSWYEAVMKYRNDKTSLKKIEQYIDENNIKIAFNCYFPQIEGPKAYISHLSDDEFNNVIKIIKNFKVDVESELAAMIFNLCFFSGIFFAGVKEKEISDFIYMMIKFTVKSVSKNSHEKIKELYLSGYETDDCENYVRKGFDKLLESNFSEFIPYVESAIIAEDKARKNKAVISIDDFFNNTNWDAESAKLKRRIAKNNTSAIYLKKSARKYWENLNDSHYTEYFEHLNKGISKISGNALQEYVKEIMVNCCENGGSFWKNDVLDAIILCNISKEDKLITFDKGVIKHMKKYCNDNKGYEESIKIINHFKKY